MFQRRFEFQKEEIAASVKLQFLSIYLADVVLILITIEKQIDHIRETEALLQRAGTFLNLKNMFFFSKNTISYPEHVGPQKYLKIAAHIASAIQAFATTLQR